MSVVQFEDTFLAVLPFLAVIGVEFVSIIVGWLPFGNWNPSVPERAKNWIDEYDTAERELLDSACLQQVLQEELYSRHKLDTELESEAREIGYAIQRNVPLDQNFSGALAAENAALAYDAGRFSFSALITTISLFAVLYSRIVDFSLSALPVSLMFLGPAALYVGFTICWLRRNVHSINDYAGFRDDYPLSPISIALVVFNLIAIASILIVDGCVGPIHVPGIPLGWGCQLFR